MNTDDAIAQDARLMILRELARQSDGRLSDVVLARVLEAYGVRRTQDWLRTQLRVLEEIGAIRREEIGRTVIATLRQAGRDHVERRGVVEGVARPADVD